MAVQYYAASTLDGFIADSDDGIEWLEALGEPTEPTYEKFIAEVGALVMGRASYEFILGHIAKGNAWPYTQPTWVLTNQKFPSREGVTFASGSVADVHADLVAAAGDKNVWVVGGGDLAGQFYDAGLLDELIITVASTTLGSGKPLFPRQGAKLELLGARQLGASFGELHYRVAKAE